MDSASRPSDAESYDAPVIAIDGPSGAGKSSMSRALARKLEYRFFDTGAMYRAFAWWLLNESGVSPTPQAITKLVSAGADLPVIVVDTSAHTKVTIVTVNGQDRSHEIRTPDIDKAVTLVSPVTAVREWLTVLLREVIGNGGIVAEGRDIGTAVAPNADVKIFYTASPQLRAQWRQGQQGGVGQESTSEQVATTLALIEQRDEIDSTRGGLRMASDAIEIQAVPGSAEKMADEVFTIVQRELARRRGLVVPVGEASSDVRVSPAPGQSSDGLGRARDSLPEIVAATRTTPGIPSTAATPVGTVHDFHSSGGRGVVL